ncbi:hypothetical protein [Geomonas oryzae]|jgi:hypothetical protein|uniref:hypothetical protein n=1 Tax=Geomonas oryzae TaxID=2364273 RepID=UPI00100A8F34|nr:hypothetical protein [Geomonas oryzae]
MSRPIKIPEQQLERVHRLENILATAAESGDLKKAKIALDDLRPILERYQHKHRVLEAYLKLYESALEAWDLDTAKQGFSFVRREASKNTRLFLEATVLLAVTHLRCQDLISAEPLMAEALRNENVITSKSQRDIFRREAIDRFDQEGAIAALAKVHPEVMDEAQIHQDALNLLRRGLNEQDIEEELGARIPQQVKEFILKVDILSRKLLPHETRLLLPTSADVVKNRHASQIIFGGVKRKLYGYVCDENSETYKAWVYGGLNALCNEGFMANAVIGVLADFKIFVPSLAIGLTALVIKKGIGNFCETNRPRRFMDLRKKRVTNK